MYNRMLDRFFDKINRINELNYHRDYLFEYLRFTSDVQIGNKNGITCRGQASLIQY